MKKTIRILLLLCCMGFLSCGNDEPKPNEEWPEDSHLIIPPRVTKIKGLNEKTFPIIDGSDSTEPIRIMLAATLAGDYYRCAWMLWVDLSYFLELKCPQSKEASYQLLSTKLKNNNTHPSYINLIDGTVDLIICARESSEDEQNYAQEKGVTLIEKPIALDSFAFLLNRDNSVDNLTHEQVVGIYSGAITNWSQVGGEDQPIKAFTRNRNSGSQEKMEKLVMQGVPMIEVPAMVVGSMMAPYYSLEVESYGIAYSPYYYYLNMSGSTEKVKAISINGVPPTKEFILNKQYPYISDVVAVIRSDTPAKSYTRKIFDYLTTPDGKKIIEASGYVTN